MTGDYTGAPCTREDVDPDWWFPEYERGTQIGKAELYKAKTLCAQCPFRQQCLDEHLTAEFGIFGGLPPATRKRIALERGIPWVDKNYDEIVVERCIAGDKPDNNRRLRPAERREVVRRMWREGRTGEDILANTGMNSGTLQRELDRIKGVA